MDQTDWVDMAFEAEHIEAMSAIPLFNLRLNYTYPIYGVDPTPVEEPEDNPEEEAAEDPEEEAAEEPEEQPEDQLEEAAED